MENRTLFGLFFGTVVLAFVCLILVFLLDGYPLKMLSGVIFLILFGLALFLGDLLVQRFTHPAAGHPNVPIVPLAQFQGQQVPQLQAQHVQLAQLQAQQVQLAQPQAQQAQQLQAQPMPMAQVQVQAQPMPVAQMQGQRMNFVPLRPKKLFNLFMKTITAAPDDGEDVYQSLPGDDPGNDPGDDLGDE